MTLEVYRLLKVAYISTGEILVKVNFKPFKITYLHGGYELISERWGYEKEGNLEKFNSILKRTKFYTAEEHVPWE